MQYDEQDDEERRRRARLRILGDARGKRLAPHKSLSMFPPFDFVNPPSYNTPLCTFSNLYSIFFDRCFLFFFLLVVVVADKQEDNNDTVS
jgi:hypothetical protein